MKLFLALMLTSCAFSAFAQSTNGADLFPEFAAYSSKQPKAKEVISTSNKTDEPSVISGEPEDKDEVTFNEDINEINDSEEFEEEEDLFKESDTTSKPQNAPQEEEKQTEEDEKEADKEQLIYITITDVEATLTAARNASFCSAGFVVINGLKKTINTFSGEFTIGTMKQPFSFSNIEKENAQGAKYTFIGKSCEEILNPPAYTINKCQVEGWSEKKCKSKVKFVPIPKEDSTLQ